jgi:hypothetical protein
LKIETTSAKISTSVEVSSAPPTNLVHSIKEAMHADGKRFSGFKKKLQP